MTIRKTHMAFTTNKALSFILLFALLATTGLVGCKKKAAPKTAQKKVDVMADYFEPYADVTATRDLSNEAELKFREAMNLYNQKDYGKAIPAFEALVGEESDIKINFYTGVSYLANGQGEKAAEQLRFVLEDKDDSYDTQAKWYLALACLDQNKDVEAAPLLAELRDKNTSYKQKASGILAAMPNAEALLKKAATAKAEAVDNTFYVGTDLEEGGWVEIESKVLGNGKEITLSTSQEFDKLNIRYNKLMTDHTEIRMHRKGVLMHEQSHDGLRRGETRSINLKDMGLGKYDLQVKVDNNLIKQKIEIH